MLFSMHFEKCGGTSFARILEREYGNSLYMFKMRNGGEVRFPVRQLITLLDSGVEIKVIHGHMFYGIHSLLCNLGSSHQYFTVLRDPVARYISHSLFLTGKYEDLSEVRSIERLAKDVTDTLSQKSQIRISNLYVRRLVGKYDQPLDGSDIETAFSILKSFKVGFLEEFDAFIKHLSTIYNWSSSNSCWLNASGLSTYASLLSYSLPIAEDIMEANRYDIELYNRTLQLHS